MKTICSECKWLHTCTFKKDFIEAFRTTGASCYDNKPHPSFDWINIRRVNKTEVECRYYKHQDDMTQNFKSKLWDIKPIEKFTRKELCQACDEQRVLCGGCLCCDFWEYHSGSVVEGFKCRFGFTPSD